MLRYMVVCLLLASSIKAEVKITKMHITSDVIYRFNTVKITTVIVNEGPFIDDIVFQQAIPNDAFISNFTMKMDDAQFNGHIVSKIRNLVLDANQRHPQNYNLRPRGTNLFRISIKSRPKAVAEFTLVYEQLLIRKGGEYDVTLYLHPGNVVNDFKVNVNVRETRKITNVRAPPPRGELLSFDEEAQNSLAGLWSTDPQEFHMEFSPTPEQQMKESSDGLKALLSLYYDVERGNDAGDLFIFEDYFVHFFAPNNLKTLPRDIVFVLDDSSSMKDTKLEQMKRSLFKILDSLSQKDRIHFIQFSDQVTQRSEGFVEVTPESIVEAKHYVEKKFIANGGTNIDSGLREGLHSFKKLPQIDEARVKMLIFLTDGHATVGEKNREIILKNLISANIYNASIFGIGFGADSDYALMKRISYEHNGIACRIYDAVDADAQIYAFMQQITRILLLGVTLEYDSHYIQDKMLAMFGHGNYYNGSEIGVIGKLNPGHQGKIDVIVKEIRNGRSMKVNDLRGVKVNYHPGLYSSKSMERMWAFVFFKYLIKNFYMRKNKSMYQQLRLLSLKYHFLNDMTHMKVNSDQHSHFSSGFYGINPEFKKDQYAGYMRDDYGMKHSKQGEYMKEVESGVINDPHFIIHLPTLELPLCFEVPAQSGQHILLLDDPTTGERVTATVVASKVKNKDGHLRTYLGAVKIAFSSVVIHLTPRMIRVNNIPLSWAKESSLKVNEIKLVVTGSGQHVNIYVDNSTHFMVKRTLVSHNDLKRVNYLNFYIIDYTGLSSDTTGLLGQFGHTSIYSKKSTEFQMLSATQELFGNDGNGKKFQLQATLIERLELLDSHSTKPCWKIPMLQNSALFAGKNINHFFVKFL